MDLNTILMIVGAVGGGGAVGALAQVYIGKQKIDQVDRADDQAFLKEGFKLAVEVVTGQRDDAFRMLEDVRKRLDANELEIAGLKLSSGFDPFPRWMVDLEGRYIYLNACFEEKYLFPRSLRRHDVIGQGHEIIFDGIMCKKLKEMDAVARNSHSGRARAALSIEDEDCTIYKFPVRVQGVTVAYAGYIMDN